MQMIAQTKFGNGNGNCLLACVASILSRKIEDIPDFNLSGCGWFEDLYEWCLNEDIGLIRVSTLPADGVFISGCPVIMCFGVEDSDEEHAVVGKCVRAANQEHIDGLKWSWECELVFDPNPNGVTVTELRHLILLIPKR